MIILAKMIGPFNLINLSLLVEILTRFKMIYTFLQNVYIEEVLRMMMFFENENYNMIILKLRIQFFFSLLSINCMSEEGLHKKAVGSDNLPNIF